MTNNNNKFPKMLYGTAWKENETEPLVIKSIEMGFTGIDTANQRVHYYEEAVGRAIKKALDEGVKREDLFIQTKFTYVNGQNHRPQAEDNMDPQIEANTSLPYDIDGDIQTQVNQSFNSSLEHLQIDYIDSYLLHSPEGIYGLTATDWKAWKEMESIQKNGKVKYLGISNVNFEQLKELYSGSEIKPTFVQNRCFAYTKWDENVRNFCKEHDIIYQGFSLLTANTNIFSNQGLIDIINKSGKTPEQVIFAFAIQIGMMPLTGTTNETHMKEDLSIIDFSLSDEDVSYIENIAYN